VADEQVYFGFVTNVDEVVGQVEAGMNRLAQVFQQAEGQLSGGDFGGALLANLEADLNRAQELVIQRARAIGEAFNQAMASTRTNGATFAAPGGTSLNAQGNALQGQLVNQQKAITSAYASVAPQWQAIIRDTAMSAAQGSTTMLRQIREATYASALKEAKAINASGGNVPVRQALTGPGIRQPDVQQAVRAIGGGEAYNPADSIRQRELISSATAEAVKAAQRVTAASNAEAKAIEEGTAARRSRTRKMTPEQQAQVVVANNNRSLSDAGDVSFGTAAQTRNLKAELARFTSQSASLAQDTLKNLSAVVEAAPSYNKFLVRGIRGEDPLIGMNPGEIYTPARPISMTPDVNSGLGYGGRRPAQGGDPAFPGNLLFVNEGAKALDINKLSVNPGEQEVILGRSLVILAKQVDEASGAVRIYTRQLTEEEQARLNAHQGRVTYPASDNDYRTLGRPALPAPNTIDDIGLDDGAFRVQQATLAMRVRNPLITQRPGIGDSQVDSEHKTSPDPVVVEGQNTAIAKVAREAGEVANRYAELARRIDGFVVVQKPSPLDYGGDTRTRLELQHPDAPPPRPNEYTFDDHTDKRGKVTPGTDPTALSFVDYHQRGENSAYIDYMSTRSDARGQGYSEKALDALYQQFRGGIVDFGEIMHDAAAALQQKMAGRYPDVETRGYVVGGERPQALSPASSAAPEIEASDKDAAASARDAANARRRAARAAKKAADAAEAVPATTDDQDAATAARDAASDKRRAARAAKKVADQAETEATAEVEQVDAQQAVRDAANAKRRAARAAKKAADLEEVTAAAAESERAVDEQARRDITNAKRRAARAAKKAADQAEAGSSGGSGGGSDGGGAAEGQLAIEGGFEQLAIAQVALSTALEVRARAELIAAAEATSANQVEAAFIAALEVRTARLREGGMGGFGGQRALPGGRSLVPNGERGVYEGEMPRESIWANATRLDREVAFGGGGGGNRPPGGGGALGGDFEDDAARSRRQAAEDVDRYEAEQERLRRSREAFRSQLYDPASEGDEETARRQGFFPGIQRGLSAHNGGGSAADQIGFQLGQAAKYTVAYQSLRLIEDTLRDSVTETINFERGVTNIANQFSLATGNARELANTLGDIAAANGLDPSEGAALGQQYAGVFAGQADPKTLAVQGATLGSQLNVVAGGGDASKQLADLTAATRAFNLTNADTGRVLDASTNAAKKFLGSLDPSSVLPGLAQVGDIAKQNGLDVEQTASLLADIQARTGLTSTDAANQLSRVLGKEGSANLNKLYAQQGIDPSLNPTQQFAELSRKYNDPSTSEQERSAISSQFSGGGRTAPAAVAALEDFPAILDAASESSAKGGSFLDSYNAHLNDLRGTITQLSGAFKNLTKDLGESGVLSGFGLLIKAALPMARLLDELLKDLNRITSFNGHATGIRDIAIALGEVAVAYKVLQKLNVAGLGKVAGVAGVAGRGSSTLSRSDQAIAEGRFVIAPSQIPQDPKVARASGYASTSYGPLNEVDQHAADELAKSEHEASLGITRSAQSSVRNLNFLATAAEKTAAALDRATDSKVIGGAGKRAATADETIIANSSAKQVEEAGTKAKASLRSLGSSAFRFLDQDAGLFGVGAAAGVAGGAIRGVRRGVNGLGNAISPLGVGLIGAGLIQSAGAKAEDIRNLDKKLDSISVDGSSSDSLRNSASQLQDASKALKSASGGLEGLLVNDVADPLASKLFGGPTNKDDQAQAQRVAAEAVKEADALDTVNKKLGDTGKYAAQLDFSGATGALTASIANLKAEGLDGTQMLGVLTSRLDSFAGAAQGASDTLVKGQTALVAQIAANNFTNTNQQFSYIDATSGTKLEKEAGKVEVGMDQDTLNQAIATAIAGSLDSNGLGKGGKITAKDTADAEAAAFKAFKEQFIAAGGNAQQLQAIQKEVQASIAQAVKNAEANQTALAGGKISKAQIGEVLQAAPQIEADYGQEVGVRAAQGKGNATQNKEGQGEASAKAQLYAAQKIYDSLKKSGASDADLKQQADQIAQLQLAVASAVTSHLQALGALAVASISPLDVSGQLQTQIKYTDEEIKANKGNEDALIPLRAQRAQEHFQGLQNDESDANAQALNSVGPNDAVGTAQMNYNNAVRDRAFLLKNKVSTKSTAYQNADKAVQQAAQALNDATDQAKAARDVAVIDPRDLLDQDLAAYNAAVKAQADDINKYDKSGKLTSRAAGENAAVISTRQKLRDDTRSRNDARALAKINPQDDIALAERAVRADQSAVDGDYKNTEKFYTDSQKLAQDRQALNQLRIAKANALLDSNTRQGDPLASASSALQQAKNTLSGDEVKNAKYYQDLAAVHAAELAYAQAVEDHARVVAELAGDTTDPVEQARIDLQTATRKLNDDKKNKTGDLAQDQLNKETAAQALQKAQFEQNLSNQQTAYQLHEESADQYLSFLKSQDSSIRKQLAGMKKGQEGYQQLVDELNTIDTAIQGMNDQLEGQFNLGSIKLPTVYEVRRAEAQGATAASSSVANAVTTNNITINGADMQTVINYLSNVLGKSSMTVATTGRKGMAA
jgi:hypothetical protein